MRDVKTYLVIAALSVSLGVGLSCSSDNQETGSEESVPLPYAWPRLPLPETDSMKSVAGVPVDILINSAAEYDVLETYPPGLTVRYPKSGVEVYYTFIKPETEREREAIIDARRQRISLNLNGIPAKTIHSTDGGESSGVLVTASSGSQFPVQLLAETQGWIVTATSFIRASEKPLPYDSILPLIGLIEKDMKRTVKGVRFEE